MWPGGAKKAILVPFKKEEKIAQKFKLPSFQTCTNKRLE